MANSKNYAKYKQLSKDTYAHDNIYAVFLKSQRKKLISDYQSRSRKWGEMGMTPEG